jgi:uncharacterized protein (DUF3820 family)
MEEETPQTKRGRPMKKHLLPFGKYKSRELKDIIEFDPTYCNWLYRQSWMKKFDDLYNILDTHLKSNP